jgi:alpha-D-ribose 1-methylphosphonate 5-triphosphate diphosphatase PhnM
LKQTASFLCALDGRIEAGLRADLVRVRRMGTQNHVVAVWRQWRRVL